MNDAKFVYVIYIAAKPDKVFQALIDGELTRQYWFHENVSDWKPGSRWEHRRLDGDKQARVVGKVLECVPPKRLVLTWAAPENEADKSKYSRVTLEVEPAADMVRLSVTHEELERDSEMLKGISGGWPRVLSSLKSFLETGKPLDIMGWKKQDATKPN
jgi:uncharacterized protein YndB with AHSA1/START domain